MTLLGTKYNTLVRQKTLYHRRLKPTEVIHVRPAVHLLCCGVLLHWPSTIQIDPRCKVKYPHSNVTCAQTKKKKSWRVLLKLVPASQFLHLFRVTILDWPSRKLATQFTLPLATQHRIEEIYSVSEKLGQQRTAAAGGSPRRYGKESPLPPLKKGRLPMLLGVSGRQRCKWPRTHAAAAPGYQ